MTHRCMPPSGEQHRRRGLSCCPASPPCRRSARRVLEQVVLPIVVCLPLLHDARYAIIRLELLLCIDCMTPGTPSFVLNCFSASSSASAAAGQAAAPAAPAEGLELLPAPEGGRPCPATRREVATRPLERDADAVQAELCRRQAGLPTEVQPQQLRDELASWWALFRHSLHQRPTTALSQNGCKCCLLLLLLYM